MIFQEMGWRGMHRIDVAENTDRWQALMNAGMTLQVPESVGAFLD
jgi:hypothetical protein